MVIQSTSACPLIFLEDVVDLIDMTPGNQEFDAFAG